MRSSTLASPSFPRTQLWSRVSAVSELALITLLTPVVLLVHGYHPFADDAGIYVAGIRAMLNPQLFQVDADFVTAHTRLSVFSHVFAWTIRTFHLPLELALLSAYLLSVFAFLLGSLRLAQRIFQDGVRPWGATLLASVLFTLPVAATALTLMDPYVTARSFSTPFSLFALAACMDRAWLRTAAWLLLVSLMHPLMGVYLAAFLLVYLLVSKEDWTWLIVTCVAAFLSAFVIYVWTMQSALPQGYREAALSRGYFFLSCWHWFEWLGLALPLLLMLVAVLRSENLAVRNLCLTFIATGTTAWLVSVCFIHTSGSFFLARIQPLRTFQMIYLIGVLLLGGFLAHFFRGRLAIVGAGTLMFTAGLMMLVQRQTYPASAHVEWPFAAPRNPWQQAFVWIRYNTPQNAIFALDSNYTKSGAEDTQGFRATAARSALVDDLKDGGVVAIFPALAPQWKKQRDLEEGLDGISDHERMTRLKPMGVTWLLLRSSATTQFDCPYRNSVVKVCRLP
ncbi:MAG: hypothetical protein QJR10_11735 [Bacillota bacterium]|nr:hypothetical protein [Bacillota bacterium]